MTTTATKKQEKTQTAFNRASAGYELFESKLEPFSAMRQAAASALGLRFGMVDEADIFKVTVETIKNKKAQKQDLQFYNQMFYDCIIVMWLCTIPTSRVLRALRKQDEAKQEAFEWADRNGISITSPQYFQTAAVFFQIMQDVATSTGVPDVSTNNGATDDEDPNE